MLQEIRPPPPCERYPIVRRSELRLLAIAGPPVLDPARLPDACAAAEAGGVTAIQLRVKQLPAARIMELALRLRERLTIPLYVNDRADIALACGADGVHVGAEDLPPSAVRALAGDTLCIGVSVGAEEEVARALREGADYWSIGSIYRTATKADAGTPIGIDGFRTLSASAPEGMTVIAIGGIDAGRVTEVLEAGADGVAVSQAVFGAPDVERSARALRRAIERSLGA